MRVIAGSARSLKLKTIEGMSTRPTTDRIKETLFNMLNPYITSTGWFLDLFAGSGGIGIEALSRGCERAVFVDNNIKCTRCIQENLKFTHFENQAEVMSSDVYSAISMLNNKNHVFDIIFLDPPYNNEIEKQVLLSLDNTKLVNEDTLIVAEASLETDFSYLEATSLHIIKEKIYKTNKHIFIMKK